MLYLVLQKVVGFFSGGMNAASTLSVIVVVIYGAKLTISGSMTSGALTSFILYSLTGKFTLCLKNFLQNKYCRDECNLV